MKNPKVTGKWIVLDSRVLPSGGMGHHQKINNFLENVSHREATKDGMRCSVGKLHQISSPNLFYNSVIEKFKVQPKRL